MPLCYALQVYLKKAKRDQYSETPSEFLQWVYSERAKALFEKENPINPIEEAARKYQGPLTTLAVIAVGFYSIPSIQYIVKLVSGSSVSESGP